MTLNRGNPRSAKVSPDQVLNIRRLYSEGWTQGQLAREYNLSIGQVGRIVRNEAHQNLEPVSEGGRYRRDAAPVTDSDIQASLAKLQAELDKTPPNVDKDLEEFLK